MKFKEYANSFQAIARLELESIKLLTEYLGHPENDLKFIHVAGTNGKGSVCAFLQEIFTSAGYKCGKYISPNMVSVCERISVDGVQISEDELNEVLKTVQGLREPLVWRQENPVFHSSCKLELGIALQSLQGKIDIIYACVQDLVFHYWANRDLRVAFSTHPESQASS